jgi:hypothetical protein
MASAVSRAIGPESQVPRHTGDAANYFQKSALGGHFYCPLFALFRDSVFGKAPAARMFSFIL